jgi:hypothetical protein
MVGEPGKIGQTAWQNQLDMAKNGSATVCVNRALLIYMSDFRARFCNKLVHFRV